MASRVALVNGLPGSGKTTLAEALAAALAAPLLSKDKEALAGTLPPQGATPELGGIAMDTLWALARATAGMVVLESYWFRPRDLTYAEAGLRGLGAARVVEIWCDVPSELARSRYARRVRHTLHHDARRLAQDWDTWAAQAEPLALTPVIRVDTSQPVEVPRLIRAVQRQ